MTQLPTHIQEEIDLELSETHYCHDLNPHDCRKSSHLSISKDSLRKLFAKIFQAGQDRERERVVALRSKIEGLGKRKKDVDSQNDLIYGGIYNSALKDVLKLLE